MCSNKRSSPALRTPTTYWIEDILVVSPSNFMGVEIIENLRFKTRESGGVCAMNIMTRG